MPNYARLHRLWRVTCITVLLAGCTYRGDIDNPAVRKVSWFSYLDGTDIRAACVEGAPDSYRLVYNGRYEEQLRSYEIIADGAGGAHLTARAKGRMNAFDVSLDDVLAPWRWKRSETRLSPAEFQQFVALLEQSGQFAGAPVGLRLFSGDFYWVGSACRNGAFHYHAWAFSNDGFARLRFADFLFKHDQTGLAVNPPHKIPASEFLGPQGRQEDQTQIRFWLQVREDGLGGIPNAF
jgi:hypothetical protein